FILRSDQFRDCEIEIAFVLNAGRYLRLAGVHRVADQSNLRTENLLAQLGSGKLQLLRKSSEMETLFRRGKLDTVVDRERPAGSPEPVIASVHIREKSGAAILIFGCVARENRPRNDPAPRRPFNRRQYAGRAKTTVSVDQ